MHTPTRRRVVFPKDCPPITTVYCKSATTPASRRRGGGCDTRGNCCAPKWFAEISPERMENPAQALHWPPATRDPTQPTGGLGMGRSLPDDGPIERFDQAVEGRGRRNGPRPCGSQQIPDARRAGRGRSCVLAVAAWPERKLPGAKHKAGHRGIKGHSEQKLGRSIGRELAILGSSRHCHFHSTFC
jgi:hypothetical protein